MTELLILVGSEGGARERELAEELRLEIDQQVGAARWLQQPAAPGAKGAGLAEAAHLAVAVLSAPAVAKLVELICSFLLRDRRTQFEFEGPNGKLKITGDVGRDQVRAAIQQVLGLEGKG